MLRVVFSSVKFDALQNQVSYSKKKNFYKTFRDSNSKCDVVSQNSISLLDYVAREFRTSFKEIRNVQNHMLFLLFILFYFILFYLFISWCCECIKLFKGCMFLLEKRNFAFRFCRIKKRTWEIKFLWRKNFTLYENLIVFKTHYKLEKVNLFCTDLK